MIGTDRIVRIIPHRAPVLLLDEVTEVVPGERLTARRLLSRNDRDLLCVAGPVRDGPVVPGTVVLESWAQAGALLACWDRPHPALAAAVVVLASRIDRVRFGGPVRLGSVLVHRVRMVRAAGDAAILEGETVVAGTTVLEVGKFVLARRPPPV
ncbi:3-hydroxyacyl-ACP dehydratase FabZ family protein [Amycolatopsis samaneae]|uniref:3-hydroxyacyl-ACP dehydratase FabZ family protein n=1 Tax=Amycolatopsis samaneae TaxID=664691 RepID=A0ABW5GP86_9PSEU